MNPPRNPRKGEPRVNSLTSGHVKDVPKPHLWYWSWEGRDRRVKREIHINITRYVLGLHYYVSIRTETDYIWDPREDDGKGRWKQPWDAPRERKGECLSESFKTVQSAERWVASKCRRLFPVTKYKLRDDWQKKQPTIRRLFYSREGDRG